MEVSKFVEIMTREKGSTLYIKGRGAHSSQPSPKYFSAYALNRVRGLGGTMQVSTSAERRRRETRRCRMKQADNHETVTSVPSRVDTYTLRLKKCTRKQCKPA